MSEPSGPASTFMMPPGVPAIPGAPGTPGLVTSPPLTANSFPPPAPTDSSSFPMPRPLSSVPALPQQQVYSPYPGLPAVVPPPQGLWLQPPQMAALPRPPFLTPYPPPVYPAPIPLPARGPTLPSVPLPDSQPPGVTVLASSVAAATASQPMSSSEMQAELPPGVDNAKQVNSTSKTKDGDGEAINEQFDAWTAHKTDTGTVYYYNAITGVSTYEKPSGFKVETDKVAGQPTPVSWEKLAGTEWALVMTNDGKKYYYNTRTKLSSWQVPPEVAELRKKHDSDTSKDQSDSHVNSGLSAEKTAAPSSLTTPAINTGGRDATPLRNPGALGSSSALDLIKKKLQDSGTPVTSSPLSSSPGSAALESNSLRAAEAVGKSAQSETSKEKLKDANGDGNESYSSSDSEDVDSGPTTEERIIQFKEMLKECGVAPFSKWEKELPKIVFDPRFKAVPSYAARRSLFEHYVRTRAEEERKEKRAAQKAAIEGFRQLLEEVSEDINHKTDYETFKKKWGNDPRFEALDRKEREVLLNERILPLKKAAEEKAQAQHRAAASSFKSMLHEKGDITSSSRWSRVKDSLRNDPRYKFVKHEDRESLFNECISELKAVDEVAERVEKAKKEQEKLKERERELRKRKEREEQEMERVRLKVRRKEAVASYQALLVETIKDPQASWTECKPKLEKDPQGRATNPDLDESDIEKLFREHIKTLHERCANEFNGLLADVITAAASSQESEDGKTILDSWSTAKRLLKSDPRYTKMPRKERESLWRRHTEEILRKQKQVGNLKGEKHGTEARTRSSVDSGRLPVGSRSSHGRR
ncbi:FF domain [Dillenia turbinata]|uniref:FF domain n=1 Tax=Dillenia turbinata TaxID=194707 RepID=A0AAN8Z9K4_9MAGN